MSEPEIAGFLDEQRTVVCATQGRDGWPHLMPLWYVVRDANSRPELWAWTYAASQKVQNLQRDPRATLQIEAGVEYHLLRGVMIKAHTEVHRDVDTVAGVGMEIFARYAGGGDDGELGPEVREMVARQAPKRVALQFVEHEHTSWDHRKLGGVY